MSVLLFSISSTSVLSEPETNSDSNDGHTLPTPQPLAWSWVTALPSLSVLRGQQIGGVDQLGNHVHQFRENRRQPCILTSLALSSRGVKDNRKKRDRSRGGKEGVSNCRLSVLKCYLYSGLQLQLSSGPFGFISGCYKDNTNKYTIM